MPLGVLVHEPALEHPGDDLHVAVRVRLEARAGRHDVVVVHEEQPEVGVPRVVMRAEGEAVRAVEPAHVRGEPVGGTAQVHRGAKRGGHEGSVLRRRFLPDDVLWCSANARRSPDAALPLGCQA